MDVQVNLDGAGTLTDQVYRQLFDAILDGRIRHGERLPSTRDLATRLAVSRNTVALAYERLTAEGVLTGRVGAGTFVAAEAVGAPRPRSAPGGNRVTPRPAWRDLRPAVTDGPTPAYDFRVGSPDARLFPLRSWRRLVGAQLREVTVRPAGYAGPAGDDRLRAAIARHVGVSRSVRTGADDVVVTHGAQQAFDLIARVLLDPGDRVAVEEPGYQPVRRLFDSLGATIAGVPVDAEGVIPAAIPAGTTLIYTTPSHQFPLGTPMSLARRTELLDWATRADAVIIEDDYDSEFRFADRPLEPLQSMDRGGRVIYVGSFSKTLLPELRVGFLIAPASLRAALRTAKQLSDWHGETTIQAALASFLDEGLLARHLRRARRVYQDRHERVHDALTGELGTWLDPLDSAAGLHVCARLRPAAGVDLDRVLGRARAAGVEVERLARYYAGPAADDGVVIGFGGVATDRIGAGLDRLAAAFRTVTAG